MKQIFRLPVLVLFLLVLFSQDVFAEYIFLKDGEIIKGSIATEKGGKIAIRLPEGTFRSVEYKTVLRIIYAELYLGKVYINKTDGTVLEAYIISEDQANYICRKNLQKPDEFAIKRDQVLFITRTNPSGLEGKALRGKKITINWKAPYNKVKYYRVYSKAAASKDFSRYAETKKTNITVENLADQTIYSFKVTAVDDTGYESLPSNIADIKTMDKIPDPPAGVYCTVIAGEKGKSTAQIIWSPVKNEKVKVYRIYRKENDDYRQFAETAETQYVINDVNAEKSEYYVITGVNAFGVESDYSDEISTEKFSDVHVAVYGVYLLPMGDFADVYTYVYGAALSVTYNNIFLRNTEIGITASFLNASGATGDISGSYLVPVTFHAGYNMKLPYNIFITPQIFAGYSYLNITGSGKRKDRTGSGFETLAGAGAALSYRPFERLYFQTRCMYGCFPETDGFLPFLEISLGAGYIL